MSEAAEVLTDTIESNSQASLATGLAVTSGLLTACGGGGGGGAPAAQALQSSPAPGVAPSTTGAPAQGPATDEEAARFLLQAQFSASDAEFAAVRAQG